MKNYYEVLEMNENTTSEEIKEVYNEKSKICHPNRLTEKMKANYTKKH